MTDNTGSPDFHLFRRRYWGGYHFPRHWHLFDRGSMARLADVAGLEVARIGTATSPVNWTYSIRNALADRGAPASVLEWFSLRSAGSLAVFSAFDLLLRLVGRGALLWTVLRRPS